MFPLKFNRTLYRLEGCIVIQKISISKPFISRLVFDICGGETPYCCYERCIFNARVHETTTMEFHVCLYHCTFISIWTHVCVWVWLTQVLTFCQFSSRLMMCLHQMYCKLLCSLRAACTEVGGRRKSIFVFGFISVAYLFWVSLKMNAAPFSEPKLAP